MVGGLIRSFPPDIPRAHCSRPFVGKGCMIYIAEPPRSQVQVDSCNGLTCGLSLAASGGPSQSNAMEVGGTGPAKRIKDDGLRSLAVGASSSCAGPADHLSARRDVMLVLGCKESTLVRGRCGLYLADVWQVMSIAVHRHSTTRCAGHTSPTSKAVSHCGCGIHLAWEGTTGKASPPYPVPQRHSRLHHTGLETAISVSTMCASASSEMIPLVVLLLCSSPAFED